MSNKKQDKGKIIHKLHQVQKQLTGNHVDNKEKPVLLSRLKKLFQKVIGKNKPNNNVTDDVR